jgi:hypothetical protein
VILWSRWQNPRIIWQLLAIDPNYSYALKGIAWLYFLMKEILKKKKNCGSYRDYAQYSWLLYWNLRLLNEGNQAAALKNRNAYYFAWEK